MSGQENFLKRWSRRKQDVAAQEAKAKEPPAEVDAPKPVVADAPSESTVDLSKLPSLADITAETDISAFLKPGIPGDLTRAALRRAWAADPSVRDFVGLQENDWVFNKPGPAEGFGPLGPEYDVRKLIGQLFSDQPKSEGESSGERDAGPEVIGHADADHQSPSVEKTGTPIPVAAKPDTATHNEAAHPAGRSHGGALPRPISKT